MLNADIYITRTNQFPRVILERDNTSMTKMRIRNKK